MSLYVAGLDLGQSQDFTALALLETVPTLHALTATGRDSELGLPIDIDYEVAGPPAALKLLGLERYPLGTAYPQIVTHVAARLRAIRGQVLLAVDATGVGAAVVDMFEALSVPLIAITITGGSVAHGAGHRWSVPKRDLVHGLLLAFQDQRLTYANRLEQAPTFLQELVAFQLTVNTQTGHDTYEAWREGAHDDLVLAVAVACWLAEHEVDARYQAALREIDARTQAADASVSISPF